jgi:Right handed beta helix region
LEPTATPSVPATPTPPPGGGNDLIPAGVGHGRTCDFYSAITPLRKVFVSLQGSDANPGTADAPYRTLQKACDQARPGDEINVRAGIHAGCVIYKSNSGTESAPITIQAERLSNGQDADVVIDRKSAATFPTWGILNAEGADWVAFRGFRVTGRDARTGIRLGGGVGQAICNNRIERSQVWGVLAGFTTGALVENNTITEPGVTPTNGSFGQHGVYFGEGDDNYVIRGNTVLDPYLICFHNNGSGGMNSNALIERNVCRGGRGANVNMDGVENSIVRNNVFHLGNHLGIALFNQDGGLPSRNNRIIGNTFYFPGGPGFFAVAANGAAIGNKIFNNILYKAPSSTRGALAIDDAARVSTKIGDTEYVFESNHNVFVGGGAGTVNRASSGEADSPISLAQWQALGYDRNSLVLNESQLWSNASSGDFRLKPESPARENGLPLGPPLLLLDILGNIRSNFPSIGAYE